MQGFRSRQAERYLTALKSEICLVAALGTIENHLITSIYLGGGTPTQYPPEIICELIALCRDSFNVCGDVEISLESHPATLDQTKLIALRKGGVNRLSLGVQSFSDQHLLALGRHHTASEADMAFHAARSAGFDNIAIDLIYGLPNQNDKDWQQSLQHAIKLSPEHLSMYALSIEEGTLFARLEKEGKLQLPNEAETLGFYETARKQFIDAGYEHYEISNFAKVGKQCRHNLLYWDRGETMAFGLAAHAYFNHRHQENTEDLTHYIDALEDKKLPLSRLETVEARDAQIDRIIFGLRKIEGIPVDFFEGNEDLCHTRDRLAKEGLLSILEGRVRLTSKALLLADEVALAFL